LQTDFETYIIRGIIGYYEYDYSILFEYLDDNVMWYGPNAGDVLIGKQALMDRSLSYTKFAKKKKFVVSNLSSKLIYAREGRYSAVCQFRLFSTDSDGKTKEYNQRIIINGQKLKNSDGEIFWRVPFISVANLNFPKSSSSNNTEISPTEQNTFKILSDSFSDKQVPRLVLPGENHVSIYLKEDMIKYAVGGKSVKCYIYTTDGKTLVVRMLLKDLEAMLPTYYYRCHSSYIVNLRNVQSLSSKGLTLVDGTVIPISVKKYRETKNVIDDWMLMGQ